ncbi:MAG: ankyrin repeat domain-containing protein [Opitutaceae bacterium]|jgi:hypothetical protein
MKIHPSFLLFPVAVLLAGMVCLPGCATPPVSSAPAQRSLHEAAACGDAAEVRRLLDGGADANMPSSVGWGGGGGVSVLHENLMGRHADLETVKVLLDHGANINARWPNVWNIVALHCAAANPGQTEILRLLLDRGADIDIQNDTGSTPLMFAADRGNADRVRLLLARGADTDIRSRSGTAAERARKAGHPEIAGLIEAAASERQAQAAAKRQEARRQSVQQLKDATLEQLLERNDFTDEELVAVLTNELIEAKNRELPGFIAKAAMAQRVDLLTTVEKRLLDAQKVIGRANGDAEDAVRQGRGAADFRQRVTTLQAYQGVLKAIQEILNQS